GSVQGRRRNRRDAGIGLGRGAVAAAGERRNAARQREEARDGLPDPRRRGTHREGEKHVFRGLTSAPGCPNVERMPLAPELTRAVDEAVDSASPELAELSRRIHANPELRFHETK